MEAAEVFFGTSTDVYRPKRGWGARRSNRDTGKVFVSGRAFGRAV